MTKIDLPDEYKAGVLLGMKGLKLFKDLKTKFEKFKDEHDDGKLIDDFFRKVNKSDIYENDIITTIIRKTIKNFKERTNKEVVLVIEDLDRIDPALSLIHIF